MNVQWEPPTDGYRCKIYQSMVTRLSNTIIEHDGGDDCRTRSSNMMIDIGDATCNDDCDHTLVMATVMMMAMIMVARVVTMIVVILMPLVCRLQ